MKATKRTISEHLFGRESTQILTCSLESVFISNAPQRETALPVLRSLQYTRNVERSLTLSFIIYGGKRFRIVVCSNFERYVYRVYLDISFR